MGNAIGESQKGAGPRRQEDRTERNVASWNAAVQCSRSSTNTDLVLL